MSLKIVRDDITKMKCDVSLLSAEGNAGEEELRSCYREGLQLACEKGQKFIAFPLISVGGADYPMEEGMRIAVDEIRAFPLSRRMHIYLVVPDDRPVKTDKNIRLGLGSYIERNYTSEEKKDEPEVTFRQCYNDELLEVRSYNRVPLRNARSSGMPLRASRMDAACVEDFSELHESELQERMKHMSDTFSEYLLYLIEDKGMTNAEVYKRAIVDKKVFSKIKY